MLTRILRKWATRRLRRQVDSVHTELDAARVALRIAQAEIDSLAAVIARDRQRVQAEAAGYARQRAEHEGTNDERTR